MTPIRIFRLALLLSPFSFAACATGYSGGIDAAFQTVESDTSPRFLHKASRLDNGLVMVTGGLRIAGLPPSLQSLTTVSFFDPATDSFSGSFVLQSGGSTTPALITGRSGHTQTTLLDGRVLITGGKIGASGTDEGTGSDTVELFDPATGIFSTGAAMSEARYDSTATLLPDGRVVLAGGSATWQVFDPSTDSWSAEYALHHNRFAYPAVLITDFPAPGDVRVLLIAGWGTGADTMELLDPNAGTSTLFTSTLTIGVDDLSAMRIPDGRILIVGGQNINGGDTISDCYLFDPATDTLAQTDSVPSLPNGISDHQMAGFGRYFGVFGGESQLSGADTELDYAAVFDSVIEAWIWHGTMHHVHDDAAGARLDDGRMLIVGGGVPFLGQTAPSANAETFTLIVSEPADLNCDATVDVLDVLVMLGVWGPCPDCPADLNADAEVNVADLLELLSVWGPVA